MRWSDEFKIDHAAIDSQHQELFQLIEQMAPTIGRPDNQEELLNALKFTVGYAKNHFAEEEKLMQTISYPEFTPHREMHQNFARQISGFLLQLKEGRPPELSKLFKFLVEWLQSHVVNEDKKIGQFMSKKRIKADDLENCLKKDGKRNAIMAKMKLLRDLFNRKQISAEAAKEKKYELLLASGNELGLEKLREFIDDLTYYRENDYLSTAEKKAVITMLLETIDIEASLSGLKNAEAKMVLARTLFPLKMITEARYNELKNLLEPDNPTNYRNPEAIFQLYKKLHQTPEFSVTAHTAVVPTLPRFLTDCAILHET
jgi:hemerythrin